MLSFQDAITRASDLPVSRLLPDFLRSCSSGSVSIISASAGSGKTTLIPLACAELLEPGQRVLVCSPRRVSARSCARRLAQLLDDRVGHLVGFSVRGQSERSASTRIEFVTPGVLTRMIHSDPELQGIGCVILDEFHERAVDSDLACAFLSDIREVLREDLRLVVMSATVDIEALRSLLADFSPQVFELNQELYPVDIVWEAPPRGVDYFQGERVSTPFLRHIAVLAARALERYPGDALVFVPGMREISKVCEFLEKVDARVIALHGQESDYAVRLKEKQRLRAQYGIREAQMRHVFEEARRTAGLTGENLVELLEMRLDALVLRAGFARTIQQARQFVVHRHIMVDGKIVDRPSFRVKPGQTLQVKPKSQTSVPFEIAAEGINQEALPATPDYLDVDIARLKATLVRRPKRAEVPVTCDVQMVVEHYSR